MSGWTHMATRSQSQRLKEWLKLVKDVKSQEECGLILYVWFTEVVKAVPVIVFTISKKFDSGQLGS